MTEVTNTIENVVFAFRAKVTEGDVIEFINLPVLKSIVFLAYASAKVNRFTINDCPELLKLVVKEGCFAGSSKGKAEIMNCPKLKAIHLNKKVFTQFDQLVLDSMINTNC